MDSLIRVETPADAPSVRAVVTAAFDGPRVADLVDLLRASAGYRAELAVVAEDDTGITGHVMLTAVPLRLPDGARRGILCLSPLSVRPDRQRRGLGRALTEHALRLADAGGAEFVVLEGDPAYYHRFGFVPAGDHGLLRPSPTIPEPAFQVRLLTAYDSRTRGQVGYPAAFWAAGGAGLPEPVEADGPFAVPWLFELARYAGWIEAVATPTERDRPVPACPGWTVADVLHHLGVIYRVVADWIHKGRRPVSVPAETSTGTTEASTDDAGAWFAAGWRDLYHVLAAAPPGTPAAGWSPYDTTIGFWRRRMVHETAIHACDILAAVGPDGPSWNVERPVALDGIDEALRLWLGTRLGDRVGGSGAIIRITPDPDPNADPGTGTGTGTGTNPDTNTGWTVGLHRHIAEVHRLPTAADARIEGEPAAVYAWLWGREVAPAVRVGGDPGAVADLRRVLTLCMR